MSVKERKLGRIDKKIHELYHSETEAGSRVKRIPFSIQRYLLTLYHEVVNDDVAIRAQSFSYLTLFSIMPILAGLFILFGFLSQWGPVQTEFQTFLDRVLEPIPADYRDTLMEFILNFKNQYVEKVHEKSTSIGILALGVLVWVSARVFFNIEDLMNRLWSVRANRPWFERIQNFVLSSVILPTFAAISFSLPSILERWGGVRIGTGLEQSLPLVLSFFVLSFMFRYFPNAKVTWRSAITGALFSAFLFGASNVFLKFYFKFGTETAYGKVAALPITAFFIYVLWFIFILGAEVSYLSQNQRAFTAKKLPNTTLGEGILILQMVELFHKRFEKGSKPVSVNVLAEHFNVSATPIHRGVRYLLKEGILAESLTDRDGESHYLLARDVARIDRKDLIHRYLHLNDLVQTFDSEAIMREIFADFSQVSSKNK